jgi:hypothetical protein
MTDFFLFFFFSSHLVACALIQLRCFLTLFYYNIYEILYFLFVATRIGSGRFNQQQQRTQDQGQRRREGKTIVFSMSWT